MLAILFSACTAAGTGGPVLFHPLPPSVNGYTLSRGALLYTNPGFLAAVRPLDRRLVEEEYRRSELPFPFSEKEEAVPPLVFFRVLLENRSTQSLVFNPLQASAFTQDKEFFTPLEISDLYLFSPAGSGVDARARSFRLTCFDGTVTVRPGEAMERYLVFPSPGNDTKTLHLFLNDLYLGGQGFDLAFSFEAFPAKE